MMCAGHPDDAFRQRLGSMQTDESTTAYAGRAVGRAETWGRLPRTYLRFGKDRSPRPMRWRLTTPAGSTASPPLRTSADRTRHAWRSRGWRDLILGTRWK
ncbi:hypothetical protein GCM10010270_59440 [Streptomyces violaceus]|nr:hypothetical protein GCM10010270_59440 [Streptomyces janthinus]